MYTNILHIYIYIYLVRHGNHQDMFFVWFPSSTSSNVFFMVSVVGFLMVSVVAGNVLFMVSVAGFSMNYAVAGGFTILDRIE